MQFEKKNTISELFQSRGELKKNRHMNERLKGRSSIKIALMHATYSMCNELCKKKKKKITHTTIKSIQK